MRMRFGRSRAGWLGGLVLSCMVATGLCAQPAQKTPSPADTPHESAAHAAAPSDSADWWLGVQCRPVDDALRTQLGLAETEGLLIEKVVPDSPAQKVDLHRHDVLVIADGKPLGSPVDLIAVVNRKAGEALVLVYLRSGQKHEIKVTPQHRPDWAREAPPTAMTAQESQLLHKWLEQLQAGEPGTPLRFRFIHPGTILPPDAPTYPPLPPNVSITITKRGSERAKVTVTRDDKKWEVAENELDKLPKDLAPYAKCMLGRGVADVMDGAQLYEATPDADRQSAKEANTFDQDDKPTSMDQRLEMMDQQLNQLRSLIEEMHREHR